GSCAGRRGRVLGRRRPARWSYSRQLGANDEAAARIAVRVEAAAIERDPLAHPDQAVATAATARRRSRAVVDDLELERIFAVMDVHARARLPGVLERVRQSLLHDPVGRQLDPERELAPVALDRELDGKAGLAE